VREKITILIASHCSKVFEIFGDLNNTTTQCGIAFDIFETEISQLLSRNLISKFYLLDTTLGNMSIKTSGSSRIVDLGIDKSSAKSFDKISATILLVEFDETSVGSIIESIFFHILGLNLNDNRILKYVT